MIFIAIVLAVLTYASFLTLWFKLPVWIRRLVLRYPLFFDIVISVAMYFGFGLTIVGLIATALLDAMLVLTFHFGQDFLVPKESRLPPKIVRSQTKAVKALPPAGDGAN